MGSAGEFTASQHRAMASCSDDPPDSGPTLSGDMLRSTKHVESRTAHALPEEDKSVSNAHAARLQAYSDQSSSMGQIGSFPNGRNSGLI